jgi:predicted nucleic-acid-binding protein
MILVDTNVLLDVLEDDAEEVGIWCSVPAAVSTFEIRSPLALAQ